VREATPAPPMYDESTEEPTIVGARGCGVVATPARHWRASLGSLLFYLIVALVLWRPLLIHLGSYAFAGGLGDPAIVIWWLGWIPHALAHGMDPLYSRYLNARVGVSAMWNNSVVTLAVLFAPLTLLLGAPVTYDLIVLLALPLSAWTCSRWLRRHTGELPAVVGGLIFGFSPFMIRHFDDPNLSFLVLVPVIFMLVEEILWRSSRPWWPAGPLLGVVLVLQLLIGSEVLLITVLAAVEGSLLIVVTHWRDVHARLGPVILGTASAGVVALMLAAWPLLQQFGYGHAVHGPVEKLNLYQDEPADLVAAPQWVLLHTARSALVATRLDINGLYIGVPLLVTLLLVTVLLRRQRRVLVAALCLITFVVFSFGNRLRRPGGGYHGPTLPWATVQHLLPITENVLPVRLAIVVWLAVAFLAAVGLQAGLDWSARVATSGRPGRMRPGRMLLVALVAVACLVPLLPLPEPHDLPITPTPTFFATADVHLLARGSTVMVVPIPNVFDDAPMIWQTRAGMWFAQIGGYLERPAGPLHRSALSSGPPTLATLFGLGPGQNVFSGQLTNTIRESALAELRAQHVSWVIVGGDVHLTALLTLVRSLLGRPAAKVLGGVWLWKLPAAT
jgi:hypothetical protein